MHFINYYTWALGYKCLQRGTAPKGGERRPILPLRKARGAPISSQQAFYFEG